LTKKITEDQEKRSPLKCCFDPKWSSGFCISLLSFGLPFCWPYFSLLDWPICFLLSMVIVILILAEWQTFKGVGL
jgi:hypothetical protein